MHFVMQNVVQLDYSSPIGLRSLIEHFPQLSVVFIYEHVWEFSHSPLDPPQPLPPSAVGQFVIQK